MDADGPTATSGTSASSGVGSCSDGASSSSATNQRREKVAFTFHVVFNIRGGTTSESLVDARVERFLRDSAGYTVTHERKRCHSR